MELTTVWFVLIAVLWTGYFVLEGFDFGVGILFPFLGRDDPADLADGHRGETKKRVMLSTIGPVWDGNEVWLLTAGGATFAAFPHWYATLFSGFYLPLLLILVALIVRALGFDYRGKVDDLAWRRRWTSPSSPDPSYPPCCGGWPSPTSCSASPSTPRWSTRVRCSPCSTRPRFSGA